MRNMPVAAALALYLLAPAADAQERTLVIPVRESMEVMLLRTSASSHCQQACVVRGAPYAAERQTETTQVLVDGNRILRRMNEQLYRDGEGRTRVESDWSGAPLVQIQDPVQKMSYRLYPNDKSGLSMAIGAPAAVATTAPAMLAPSGNGAAKVAEQLAPALTSGAATDGQHTVRALGTRQIDGVMVEGSLETTTIAAGKYGNSLPIVSTTETWTSPELKLALYVKSVDPRYGERVIRVQNIRRGEPSASLFAPPADYTVQQIARR